MTAVDSAWTTRRNAANGRSSTSLRYSRRVATRRGQRVQERPGPAIDVVGEYLTAHRAHPASTLLRSLGQGGLDGVLDPVEVVRIGQVGLPQFGCGAGELAEHQRPAEIASAGHVLLGHQVHAIAQRGYQHDVRGDEEGDQFVARHRLVHVVHDGVAHPAVLAVDVADLALDVLAHHLVALDAFAAGGGQLHHHGVVAV